MIDLIFTLAISFPSFPMRNSSKPNTNGEAFPRWKILDDVPLVTRNSIVFAMRTFVIMYTDFLPFKSETNSAIIDVLRRV
jgi:hypothetical protein